MPSRDKKVEDLREGDAPKVVALVLAESNVNYAKTKLPDMSPDNTGSCLFALFKGEYRYTLPLSDKNIEFDQTISYTGVMSDIEHYIEKLSDKLNIPTEIRGDFRRAILSFGKVTALPETAPKLYADRPKGQSIIDFLLDPDGWGPYVQIGALSRPDLKRLDPQAYMALQNWLRKNTLPPDLHIPTKSQVIDSLVEKTGIAQPDLSRLGHALERRHQRTLTRE